MTGKMGVLYPVLCKPVVPGDTFRIESACAFNFMPMPYPTQTRMRFILHFFYVRNKNLWSNWENWLQGLPDNDTGEEIVPPYIDQPVEFYKTGSLADFLGIPTTVKQTRPVTPVSSASMGLSEVGTSGGNMLIGMSLASMTKEDAGVVNYETLNRNEEFPRMSSYQFSMLYTARIAGCGTSLTPLYADGANGWTVPSPYASGSALTRFIELPKNAKNWRFNDDGSLSFKINNPLLFNSGGRQYFEIGIWIDPSGRNPKESYLMMKTRSTQGYSSGQFVTEFNIPAGQASLLYEEYLKSENAGASFFVSVTGYYGAAVIQWTGCNVGSTFGEWPVDLRHATDIDEVEGANPYYSSDNIEDTVKISALPFRAYESIYNAFYRNTHGVQPFVIDGRVQYNRYNTTLAGGADTTGYRLFQRNWELDAYTSCLPSPQQGNAPLVGISSLGRLTVVDPDTGDTSTAQLTESGDGIKVTDVNLAQEAHSKYIMRLVNSGISISDFRQVNALQRFLETNIRKGFRYVDFIEGHFGHRIKDAIMDMPEFIGGFSENVNVSMISNTTSQTDADDNQLLGSYGGQAAAFGGSNHSITHFCDDYGFIVGIMCLVPDPTYSQILPKHFFNMSPFDYYFPEFAQIGMQPITYQEVCPVQSHMQHRTDENIRITDVFGYQRPNHDLVWFPDTLHGEFRKSFSDFIINRVYAERPQLGDEFLRIKPEETNSIFNYMAPDGDVFVGQIAFDIKGKRPVPRVVIPGLGR